MKIQPRRILFMAFVIIALLLVGYQADRKQLNSIFSVTVTAIWDTARQAIPVTQTQAAMQTAQSWTPTPTLISLETTPTPTPILMSPIPTGTLPPVIPKTPFPLEGVRLSGQVTYYDVSVDLSLYDFVEPLEPQVGNYFDDYDEVKSWSADGRYLAESSLLTPIRNFYHRYQDVSVCVSDTDRSLSFEKCIRVYPNRYSPQSFTQGHYGKITSISWSPDNEYLIVAAKGGASPCLIEVQSSAVDCNWVNFFPPSTYIDENIYQAEKVLRGAYAIAWSTQNENKLAVPLKTNWYPISQGIQAGEYFSSVWYFDFETGDLKQGLYLVDIPAPYSYVGQEEHPLNLLWEAPENTTINHEQLPLWTSDGKKIAFVYIDPWFNVERNIPTLMWPVANYVVGLVNEETKGFERLFDSRDIYASGILPTDSNLPIIHLHKWVHRDRFLLFTVTRSSDQLGDHLRSLLLYDMQTRQFFQVTTWVLVD